jgi:hypothetical protein
MGLLASVERALPEYRAMPPLKPGTRLRSAVCSTELMVIQAPAAEVEITCGGSPMLPLGPSPPGRSEAARPPGSSPQASEASAQRAEGERSSSGRAAAQQPTERSRQTRDSSATNSPASGTLIGKRYVNAAGDLELLCTKPGAGALAADGAPLAMKGAKPLPSSD